MPMQRWMPILVVIFIFGIILRLPMLVALSTTLMIVIGVSYWWYRHSLDGVFYRRRFFYHRAFPGEQVALQIEIENRKLLPLSWLRVADPWPRAIGPDDEEILAPSHIIDRGLLMNVFTLRWYERARRNYSLVFRKRGSYAVGPARLTSGDIFGFFEQSQESRAEEHITVFPPLVKNVELGFPAEDPFGDHRSRRRLFEDPNRMMGVRAYHPEDGFRRMHWPATARTGELQVKVFQPTSAPVMVMCMNVSTFTRHWEGINPELLEYLISLAATLIHQGIESGYKVGLIANGCLAHADQPFRIPPGRSPQQLAHLLEALASVTTVVTAQFERFLLREIPRIPFGATLIILTAITTPELAETLIQLKRHERQFMLISLAETSPPILPGISIVHLPFKAEA